MSRSLLILEVLAKGKFFDSHSHIAISIPVATLLLFIPIVIEFLNQIPVSIP